MAVIRVAEISSCRMPDRHLSRACSLSVTPRYGAPPGGHPAWLRHMSAGIPRMGTGTERLALSALHTRRQMTGRSSPALIRSSPARFQGPPPPDRNPARPSTLWGVRPGGATGSTAPRAHLAVTDPLPDNRRPGRHGYCPGTSLRWRRHRCGGAIPVRQMAPPASGRRWFLCFWHITSQRWPCRAGRPRCPSCSQPRPGPRRPNAVRDPPAPLGVAEQAFHAPQRVRPVSMVRGRFW